MLIATTVILLLALLYAAAYPRTKYAPRYSQTGFRSIKEGMTTNEVRKIIGDPLFVHGGQLSEVAWEYSLDDRSGPLDLGCHSRTVFSVGGVVTGKSEVFVWRMPWQ